MDPDILRTLGNFPPASCIFSEVMNLAAFVGSVLMFQDFHMPAARCQWALVMFFLIFISTFAIEFRHNRFDAVCTDNPGRPVALSETDAEVFRNEPDQL
ncbi:putative transmembrane protein 150C [Scophthalmus maximus]|uniref:Putative transmembrane protein 150C n=1 Tax=Scophthalmus maximus TaxID=52904 RepID=A0A2U9BA65_SCOMX|nr:putative transmembrane protein 150C [Scophthalmus maximus]